jgi:hypothetical protein
MNPLHQGLVFGVVSVFGSVADVTVSALPDARENVGTARMIVSMAISDMVFLIVSELHLDSFRDDNIHSLSFDTAP